MERIKSRARQLIENVKDALLPPTFENLSSNFPHLDSCLQDRQLEVKAERVFTFDSWERVGTSDYMVQKLSCGDCGVSEQFRGKVG